MEQHTNATRHDVLVHGMPVAYWEYANSAEKHPSTSLPVVLVHGFRGDHHGLELIASQIESPRVIVPDLPGFGQTPRMANGGKRVPHTLHNLGQWLKWFCEAVCHTPFLLVGHSFGTLVVASSLREGCRPAEVLLINPISSPALEGPRGVLSQLALLYYRVARLTPERIGNALLNSPSIVRLMSETMAKTKDMHLRAWIHEQHDRHFSTFTDRESLNEAFTASISHTVHEFTASFTMPTIIVAADRDDITPLAEQLRLTREIPNAELVVVPNVGHLVHYEAPTVVSDILNERISELGNASAVMHS